MPNRQGKAWGREGRGRAAADRIYHHLLQNCQIPRISIMIGLFPIVRHYKLND
jgi:hypothetical protein